MRIEYQKVIDRYPEDERNRKDIIPKDLDNSSESELYEIRQHLGQRRVVEWDEGLGTDCVQAFINNISFPTTLEELIIFSDGLSLVDSIRESTRNEWTVPKWAKAGDVVFFMHSKTARSIITRLRTELLANINRFSREQFQLMMSTIDHGLKTHTQFGGKIFAIGRVSGGPEYVDDSPNDQEQYHWKSRCYAEIDNIVQLSVPVDISEFSSFITVSRGGAITPVWGNDFERLQAVISRKNRLPWYVSEATSRPLPLRKINRSNWITVANGYRRCFILEKQFRSFYVDYLLSSIGDRRKLYSECRCTKPGINPSFIDNVFLYMGRYLAVEVKLSVAAEPNIKAQVSKYCYNTYVCLDSQGKQITWEDMYPGKVLIIDTDALYMYDAPTDTITSVFKLDMLQSDKDLASVRRAISAELT